MLMRQYVALRLAIAAMDRDEYAVETGATPVVDCFPQEASAEPALDEACARHGGRAIAPAQVIEALLFSADTPLSAARLAELVGQGSTQEVRLWIADLNDKYVAAGLSFRIAEIARGYQMLTQPEYRPWLAKLNRQQAQLRLSAAALETLSIIAYKQPVIRADIEAIRGVGCGEVVNRLREMGLIRIVGRAEIVGRPILYGTTRKFLDVFGLADLDDLPPLETLTLRRSSPRPVACEAGVPDAEIETPVAAAGA